MGRGALLGAVIAMVVTLAAAVPGVSLAQAQAVTLDSLAGAWEGTAQTPEGEAALKALFVVAEGKLAGTIESSMGPIGISSSSFADGKLTIGIEYQGSAGTLSGAVRDSRIEGVWEVAGGSGTFVLTRPVAGGLDASADAVSGAWEGEASVAGQVTPFALTLRVTGETVTGEISSAAGVTPLTSGSWKDGTLRLAFPYAAGEPVTMSGALKEDKLSGVVDYNGGEASGTFSAARKQ